MPICLHRYTFLQCCLFLFFDEPSSSQISSVLTKLFLCLLLSFTHGNNHGFFFFWSKTLAEHYIVTVQWLLLSSFPFFFFFLSKKISQKLSLPKRNFRLKLSRTLMRVQRLTERYGWSFNNGDLVLWVWNVFIFFNKNSSDSNCQNHSRFTELGSWTVVRTGPYFFCMRRFLMLNKP